MIDSKEEKDLQRIIEVLTLTQRGEYDYRCGEVCERYAELAEAVDELVEVVSSSSIGAINNATIWQFSSRVFEYLREGIAFIKISSDSRDLIGYNSSFTKMFDIDIGKAVKVDIMDGRVGLLKNLQVFYELLAEVAGSQKTKDAEVYVDSIKKWIKLSVFPVEKTVVGAIFEDITYRKNIEDNLKRALDMAESSNKDLEYFAYIASHDLREPLRKVSAFADLLVEESGDSLSEDAKFYIERIVSATGRMQVLIDDLLTYSRITTRGGDFEKTSIEKVIEDVKDNLSVLISENNAQILIEGSLPVLYADPSQMRQLFQNLIANAIKYSREDVSPIIRIRSCKSDKEGMVKIELADNGKGFDEKYKDRIFMIFQRLSKRDDTSGTGIGLAVCKRIIERHGGLIDVTSKKDSGTVFSLYLPEKRD